MSELQNTKQDTQFQNGLLSVVDINIDGSEEAVGADVERVKEKTFRWEVEMGGIRK